MKKGILLLTGWGSTSAAWEVIIPALRERYQVNSIHPTWLTNSSIQGTLCDDDSYIKNLAQSLRNPVHVIAWSMGGLLAIQLAKQYPGLVNDIHFISSVPVFVSKDNQASGIDYDWYRNFVEAFDENPINALKKFLLLQTKGDQFAKSTLQFLKNNFDFEDYNLQECKCALLLLERLNLFDDLISLQCKKIFIHGERDAVVNIEAAKIAAIKSNSELQIIKNAGHVPHISHHEKVASLIKNNIGN